MTDFIFTRRSLSNGVFTDEPGETSFLEIADTDTAPFDPQRIVTADVWVADLIAQVPRSKDATGVTRGDVLVFIHGYNNTMELVLQRHRILKRDLPKYDFYGTVVSFDWPCGDTALAYLPDRREAKKTAFALVTDGIRRVAERQSQAGCDINVHLLAHSTGAYVVQEAFDDADDDAAINAVNWTVSQIALISGDISSSSMNAGDSETESVFAHCLRLTNYSNAMTRCCRFRTSSGSVSSRASAASACRRAPPQPRSMSIAAPTTRP